MIAYEQHLQKILPIKERILALKRKSIQKAKPNEIVKFKILIKKGRAQKLLERDFASRKSIFEARGQFLENGRRQKLDTKNLSNFFSKQVLIMSTIKYIIVTTHLRLLPKLLSKIGLEKKKTAWWRNSLVKFQKGNAIS